MTEEAAVPKSGKAVLPVGSGLPQALLPEGWPRPRGYANGMVGRGRLLMTGGVVGWNSDGVFAEGLGAQAKLVFENIRAILAAGGAGPEHLIRLTWYLTDIEAYLKDLRAIGAAYREVIGPFYPAMAVLQVVRLVEPAALIEIEASALLPD